MKLGSLILMMSGPMLLGGDGFPKGTWIDLTHAFSEEAIYWPTAKGFTLETEFEGQTEKGYYYEANRYSASEHGGTHLDAPIHFAEGRMAADQIPLTSLIGPGLVIDVSEKAQKDRDYQVGIADFKAWEQKHGTQLGETIVLLRTGYGQVWPDRKKYLGTDQKGPEAVAKLHFPGLAPAAAKWLVEHRKIKAIGLDTPSIDFGQSTHYESHQILFDKNIPAFENVANLEKLPEKGFWVIALPMKIKDGSGGPLRIVALVP